MHDILQPKYLSSYGRNRGRSLRPYQQGLVDNLLPQIAVDFADPLKGDWKSIALEIGFGGGEHLVAQAEHNPETLFMGAEPFINGVAKCLAVVDKLKLKNVRLYTNDVRRLLEVLPPESLDSIFMLFPDPWPKLRHSKRRLLNHETLAMLARVHKKGGRLLLATDHIDYTTWMCEHLLTTPLYRWTAQSPADFLTPPADWTETKYQRKTTEQGRAPQFFECIRN